MADAETEINTQNDFGIGGSENLPNHSTSLRGRSKFIRQATPEVPTFRDRQSAYRYAAYLVLLADVLPDDEGQEGITFDDVLSAISNT